MSKIKLTGDSSGYVEISAPNVAANNTLELGGGTKILTNLDNVFTGVTTYSGNIDLNANLDLDDNNKILIGTGDDLQIYHDGSNSYIDDTGTGRLNIRGNTGVSLRNYSDSEQFINCYTNGTVEIFYDNIKKLETTTTGATVTGTLVSDSVTSELDLSAISASISDTAVDIFVYDTRKDSDGGAWRKRTQNTSWYNETLNTSTRGSRKEFPAVAVIVTEDTKVTIYDGDDSDLPMWMVFLSGPNSSQERLLRYASNKASAMLNAVLCVATRDTMSYISFIDEYHNLYHTQDEYYFPERTGIVDRNTIIGEPAGPTGAYGIASSAANDVAMTVLPNAPIDDATGLPVPTIAVATDLGLSVIKEDRSVFDAIDGNGARNCYDVSFTKDHKIMYTGDLGAGSTHAGNVFVTNILTADRAEYDNHGDLYRWYSTSQYYPRINGGNTFNTRVLDPIDVGGHHYAMADVGVSLIEDGTSSSVSNTNGMVAYATTSYNTGWMHGDIKGAFLSDTDTTNAIEYVQNGYFNSDVSGWTIGSTGTTATLSANRMLVTAPSSGSSWGYVYQGITTEVGKTYKISLYYDRGNVDGRINVRNDSSNTVSGALFYADLGTSNDAKTYYNTFTATATTTYILLYAKSTSGGTSAYDQISVTLEKDRSVNNKGLQVFGTVTKQPVATGAELVSYSGWSSSNYLIQPYNSGLDFGTGNWSYMFWYNPNDAESGDVIFSRWSYNVDSNQGPRVTAYFNSGNLRVDTADASAGSGYQGHFGSDGTQDSNEWHCAVILRRGTNLEIWIDGVNYKNATLNSTSDGNYTDTNSILEIGHSPNSGAPEAGLELALFRVSATAPSSEQIKKMYEDEKVLFQENAKATLYGSSDAVTALGYDEDTELLHVGTSSGRSDFQGLRRINNTTTAVTTAISASDDLIAEQ